MRSVRIKEELSLVLTGTVAEEGVRRILAEYRDELTKRFSPYFLRKVERSLPVHEPDLRTSAEKASVIRKIIEETEPTAMYRTVGDGGIFTALWELCRKENCGMRTRIADIPIRQEVIEVCRFLSCDPYYMVSGEDIVLIACRRGQRLTDLLRESGIEASLIGYLTEKPQKLLRQGDQDRYLNRPKEDEWIILKNNQESRETQS